MSRSFYIFCTIILFFYLNHVIAENEILIIKGFRITHDINIPGNPAVVYDAITGDISAWWDHSFSKNPAKFYMENILNNR
jgi:hypothetical protein